MKIFITELEAECDQGYIIYEGKIISDLPPLIYHQTNVKNAKEILKNGFEYGGVLGKGEHTFGIYFAPTYKGMAGTTYNRGATNTTVMVEVSTKKLKILDTINYPYDPNLSSYKQPAYLIKQNIEENGIFPLNYDGVIIRSSYNNNSIYEIILKKEAANKNITGRIFNMRGKIVN